MAKSAGTMSGIAGLRDTWSNFGFFAYWRARRGSSGVAKVDSLRTAANAIITLLKKPTAEKRALTKKELDLLNDKFHKFSGLITPEIQVERVVDQNYLALIQVTHKIHDLVLFLSWALHNNLVPAALTQETIAKLKNTLKLEKKHLDDFRSYCATIQREASAVEKQSPAEFTSPDVLKSHLLTGGMISGVTARRAERSIWLVHKIVSGEESIKGGIKEHHLEEVFKELDRLKEQFETFTEKISAGTQIELASIVEVLYKLNQVSYAIIKYDRIVKPLSRSGGVIPAALKKQLNAISKWGADFYNKSRWVWKDQESAVNEVEGALAA